MGAAAPLAALRESCELRPHAAFCSAALRVRCGEDESTAMRPAFRQAVLGVHRWVALALALPAVVVALSGAMLVFRPELAGQVEAAQWPAGAWERMAGVARAADPGAESVEIVPRGGRAEVLLGGKWGRTLEVDPQGGRVVADEGVRAMAFPLLFRLHTRLLAGPWAEWVAALAGLVLLASATSGLALAWPASARAWKMLLRLRVRDGWRPFATDLHRVLGVAAMPLLALNALTGLVLVFSSPAALLVSAIAPRPPQDAPVGAADLPTCAPCSLDELVSRAEALVPGARAVRVVTNGPGETVLVRLRRPGENATQGMNRIFLDPASGALKRAVVLERAPAGVAMFEWLYPLHTGRWIGIAWCAALAAAGLVPLVAWATGLALWKARLRRAGRGRG